MVAVGHFISVRVRCVSNKRLCGKTHSGKSATNRESNHGSGVCKELYLKKYVPKISILLARASVWQSYVACGISSI